MKGGLWLIRILLLIGVSLLVFSPLAVHGEAQTPAPVRFDYDVSELMLPSSPVYPVVTTYREARMSFAERSPDKAAVALTYANEDAAAIGQLVQRNEFVAAINHCNVYRENFDLSVGWLAIAQERGNDVSPQLARAKNDHLGQQAVLQEATAGMPEWAIEGMDTTRAHAAALLLEGIREIEGGRAVSLYASTLEAVYPGLVNEAAVFSSNPVEVEQVEPQSDPIVIDGTADLGRAEAGTESTQVVLAPPPDIASLSLSPDTVEPDGTCQVKCSVISEEGQQLEYLWLCSSGDIDGNGDEATWTAPSRTGTYKVVVTVTDSDGQNDSLAIDIRVREKQEEPAEDTEEDDEIEAESHAPLAGSTEILGFQVTAEHKYLEPSMVGYSILVGRACTIQCDVEDPSAVTFEWTATAGQLTAEGNTLLWKSPERASNQEVTVTVTNDSGDTTTETIPFHVTTCSQCF